KQGTSLNVLGKESNGWYKINYNGKTGYVSGDYVTVKNGTSSTTPPSSSEVDKTKSYIVNTDVLNVRDKAGTHGKQIGQVKQGTSLNVLGKESNGWYKINYEGKTGYVSGEYVTVKNAGSSSTPPTSSEVDKTKIYTVNTDVLNVRDKASTSGNKIGRVYKGKVLNVLGKESNGWYKINYEGKTGYVSGEYVTVKDEEDNSTPPSSSTSKTYVVTVNSLNVRSGPSDTYSIIGSYKLNQQIQSSRLVDGWLEVNYNGKKGYVSSQYVKEKDDVTIEGTLKNRVIVLDPGHGGHDPGAVNHNGVLEKNITLNVARFAEPLLEKLGANVILTRTSDTYLTLSERTRIAEDIEADAFLSIHANSSTSDSANGLETWYYSSGRAVMAASERDAKSKILAQMVQEELVAELGLTDRGIKEGSFYVIANTRSMPSALTELGFVSNPKESLFIDDTAVQKRMAQAITRGFIRFFATY
ncbi:MAG: N-acetylmuramoyl-L-alanine amidase, partial [Bacillaceae bacterium]